MAEISENKEKLIDTVKTYFKGVKSEWGKITWPGKQQVIAETIYVIVVTIIFTVMILLSDIFFKWILDITVGKGS